MLIFASWEASGEGFLSSKLIQRPSHDFTHQETTEFFELVEQSLLDTMSGRPITRQQLDKAPAAIKPFMQSYVSYANDLINAQTQYANALTRIDMNSFMTSKELAEASKVPTIIIELSGALENLEISTDKYLYEFPANVANLDFDQELKAGIIQDLSEIDKYGLRRAYIDNQKAIIELYRTLYLHCASVDTSYDSEKNRVIFSNQTDAKIFNDDLAKLKNLAAEESDILLRSQSLRAQNIGHIRELREQTGL